MINPEAFGIMPAARAPGEQKKGKKRKKDEERQANLHVVCVALASFTKKKAKTESSALGTNNVCLP